MSDPDTGWGPSLFNDVPLPKLDIAPATSSVPMTFNFDSNLSAAGAAQSPDAGDFTSRAGGWYNGAAIADGAPGAAKTGDAPRAPYTMKVPFKDGSMGSVIVDPALADSSNDGAWARGTAAHAVGKALGLTGYAADATIDFAHRVSALAPDGDQAARVGLKDVGHFMAWPLSVGEGVANTVGDLQVGVPPAVAITGNIVRGGLVAGAGVLGEAVEPFGGGLIAGGAADRYLPPAPAIGHAIIDYIPHFGP